MYSVISPKSEYYQDFEDFMMSYKKYPYELIIRENGSNGGHPHLNVIWSASVVKRTDDFTRLIKGHMKKAELPGTESPVLIRTKNITDVNMLIGGYLQKEDNYSVLYNSQKYDIELLKGKYGRRLRQHHNRWNSIMTYARAPLDIIDYCESNQIVYSDLCKVVAPDPSQPTRKMFCENSGITVKKLLLEISKMGKVQVHHLFRKVDEIHLAVLALTVDISEIYFLD